MITCVGFNPAIDRVLEAPGFAVGLHCHARLVSCQPAGKAANVARVLGTLGAHVRLVGFVGSGDRELFRDSFRGLPVDVDLTPVDAPTRVNTTVLDPDTGTETHIREYGRGIDRDELEAFADDYIRNADTTPDDWVVFAGSLPHGLDPGIVAGIVKELTVEELRVAVDASGPLLHHLRNARLDLLKPNREELGELLGRSVSADQPLAGPAREAAAAGLGGVRLLVSDGARGAGVFTRDAAWWGRPAPGDARSTVGAGDALLAGYLAAETGGYPPAACLRRALAAARSAIDSPLAGIVDPAAIDRYEDQSSVEALDGDA